MDEVARKQREREAEIEAKLAAKKAALREGGMGERTLSRGAAPEARGHPAEERASERPRLNLKPRTAEDGARPSWRDRQAAKQPEGESSAPPPASTPRPPPSERTREEPPRRTGYVPPALRGREGGGDTGGWRSRENSRQGAAPPLRTDSSRRDDSSRREDNTRREPRDESPLPPPAAVSDGKYRPGAFRRTRGT